MALKFLNSGYFAGKVGIGTNSPGGKLDVSYTGTGGTGTFGIGEGLNIASFSPNITFNDNSTSVDNYAIHLNQSVFTIGRYTSSTSQSPDLVLESGNVGIGTTSPRYKLDLVTPQSTTQIADIVLPVNNSGDDSVGSSLMWKANYTGYTKRSAGIAHTAEGNFFRSGLAFYTNGSTSSTGDWAERMRIDMEGNVGIGTDSPDRKLHVKDSTIVVSEFEGTNTGSLLDLVNSNASQLYNGIRFTQGASSKMAITHIADGTTKGYIQIGNSWATG